MARLRIQGVVAVMNRVREQIGAGIPPAKAVEVRQVVTGTVEQVEQICRANGFSPSQLPAPTYRAYQYLKTLDLQHLPPPPAHPRAPASSPGQTIRVRNLKTVCDQIQAEMQRQVAEAEQSSSSTLPERSNRPAKTARGSQKQEQSLLEKIQAAVATVEEAAGGSSATVRLAPRSRRAYQWLKFLCEPSNLELHLSALGTIQQEVNRESNRRHIPSQRRSLGLQLSFFNLPALFRAKQKDNTLYVTAHEAFVGAPLLVLRALVRAALSGKSDADLAHVRAYAATEDFNELALLMEYTLPADPAAGSGRYHHLDEVFERVNLRYFHNSLDRPNLTWNRTITRRKLGHYMPASDTVMISITLDQARVPGYVVEYVMFHELLHKKLGIKVSGGRRYAHTAAFRAAERKFEHYEQAEAFLKKMGK